MGRYTLITSDLSNDPAYLDLPDRDRMLLYRTLLSCTTGNMAGYFRINLRTLASELLTTPDQLEEWLETDTPLWSYDRSTRQVYIPTYLKYNKYSPKSDQQTKRLNMDLLSLSPSRLDEDFVYSLIKYSGPEALIAVPERMLNTVKALYTKRVSVKGAYINKYISISS